MANITLNGVQFLDGTSPNFTLNGLDKYTMYFIRTDEDGEEGYIYFNGKKYGKIETVSGVDCGEY